MKKKTKLVSVPTPVTPAPVDRAALRSALVALAGIFPHDADTSDRMLFVEALLALGQDLHVLSHAISQSAIADAPATEMGMMAHRAAQRLELLATFAQHVDGGVRQ